jgi:Zn ribbon nucleic-acid-binding protein
MTVRLVPTPEQIEETLTRVVTSTTAWKAGEVEEWGRRMATLPMATAETLDAAATILVDSWTHPGHPGFGMFVSAHQAAIRAEMAAPPAVAPRPEHGIVLDPARRTVLSFAAYVLMPDATWRAAQGQPAEHRHDGSTATVDFIEGGATRRRLLSLAKCPRCGEDEMKRLWDCAVLTAEERYAAGTLRRETPPADLFRRLPDGPTLDYGPEPEPEPVSALDELAAARGPRPSEVW